MTDARLEMFVSAPPAPAVKASLSAWQRAPGVEAIAVMPDVHLAHDVCIGTVIGTRDALYPAAVGGDIGCGMITVRLDVDAAAITAADADALLAAFATRVPIMQHRRPQPWPTDLPAGPPHAPIDRRVARRQLGTIGRGNHFVELQADQANALWLLIHSGSRGAGQAIRTHHIRGPRTPIDANAPAGAAYLADVIWARAYARANRHAALLLALGALRDVLGARPDPDSVIECDHNHVQAEVHAGQSLWVHRKGALHAADGVPGIIPGSMGTASFQTIGRGHLPALCSSAHGAGRRLSRTAAQRQLTVERFTATMRGVWFDQRRAQALLSEAPAAYRDIGAVMRAQRRLVRVRRQLRPVLSFKGT